MDAEGNSAHGETTNFIGDIIESYRYSLSSRKFLNSNYTVDIVNQILLPLEIFKEVGSGGDSVRSQDNAFRGNVVIDTASSVEGYEDCGYVRISRSPTTTPLPSFLPTTNSSRKSSC